MSKNESGRSGILVPKLTFGGNVFGWADQVTSFSLLDALVANQLNCRNVFELGSRQSRW